MDCHPSLLIHMELLAVNLLVGGVFGYLVSLFSGRRFSDVLLSWLLSGRAQDSAFWL